MGTVRRRDLLVAGMATGALGLTGCRTDESDGGDVRAWTRVHLESGTEPWTCVPITGRRSDPIGGRYHRSVDREGNLRFTSSAANTEGSRREVWVTGDPVSDVEVRTVIAPPSGMDPDVATPQMGVALRVTGLENGKRSAIVFDTNISDYVYRQMWVALWQWNDPPGPRTLTISKATTPTPLFEYRAPIRRTQRISHPERRDLLTVDSMAQPAPRFGSGDLVDIVGTLDDTYTQRSKRVHSVLADDWGSAPAPLIMLPSAKNTKATPAALESGYVRFAKPGDNAVDPRSLYPLHVAARVIGQVAQLKTWPDGSAEPTWNSRHQAVTVDFSDADDIDVPESGRVGLIVDHLRGADQYVAYGDLEVTPLD
ncbi:MAG TPA: hypothetical protein VFN21_01735 [Acidimicrobiales bacterium]|nr:hypothetical protein [Acidimicrobiales bacterium]